jgi:ADP-ribose pyrophosphatase
MKYETLRSTKEYRGRAFDVRRDEVRLPDGKVKNLDIVEHVDSVTILPVDAEGQVWFVRQVRHPAGMELLELPAGTLEDGEDPHTCAQREVQEEVGMGAGCLRQIGRFYLSPGYSTEFMTIFLATDLFPSVLPQDDDEFIQVVRLPLSQALQMARTGQILDAKSIAAFFLAEPFLEETSG